MSKAQTIKNNALRALDARKIKYEQFTYEPVRHSAEEVAALVGAIPEQVFKTLVVLPESGQGRPLLVVIPATKELDLKKLGGAVGEKKLRMASQKEAESLTGLQVGGISALALLQKNFRVFLDAEAELFDDIYVSGGQRGLNVLLTVTDYLSITGATLVEI